MCVVVQGLGMEGQGSLRGLGGGLWSLFCLRYAFLQ